MGRRWHVSPGNLDDPRVVGLLATHVAAAQAAAGYGSEHTLDAVALRAPGISFWTIWDADELAGIGALRELDPHHGEIKSMHTAQSRRGCGVGAAMLEHLIDTARTRNYSRLSLETVSFDYFMPARALYARYGFRPCAPFGDYSADPNSIFLTLEL